jgi:hypothetical protein
VSLVHWVSGLASHGFQEGEIAMINVAMLVILLSAALAVVVRLDVRVR